MNRFCILLKESVKDRYDGYKKYCKVASLAPNDKVKKKLLTYAKKEYECYLTLKGLYNTHCKT